MNPILLDFLPLLAFYAVLSLGGIYAATAAGIVVTAGGICYTLYRRQPVRPMAWVSFVLIAVFGGATLILHDETFIKVKPTVLYWLFALVLGLAPRLAGRNFIRSLLERELRLPEPVWLRVNDSWAAFFALLGGLNLYVAFNFSTGVWATFKVFGTMGLMFLFVVAQGLILQRHLQNGEER
jgi:intracellular septation protein